MHCNSSIQLRRLLLNSCRPAQKTCWCFPNAGTRSSADACSIVFVSMCVHVNCLINVFIHCEHAVCFYSLSVWQQQLKHYQYEVLFYCDFLSRSPLNLKLFFSRSESGSLMQRCASVRLLSAACLNDTAVCLLSGWSKLHHHKVKKKRKMEQLLRFTHFKGKCAVLMV